MKRWYCIHCRMPLGIGSIWDCRMIFNNGDCMCTECYEKKKWGRIYCYCAKCGKSLRTNEVKYPSKNHIGLICQQCAEREIMPNIKITAEVDGKHVPLKTISTETFEAIKALEKPKEIPVARLVTWYGSPRLIFKPSQNIQFEIGKIYALHLKDGDVAAHWSLANDEPTVKAEGYKNIKPL